MNFKNAFQHTYSEVNERFGFLCNSTQMSQEGIKEACTKLTQLYSNDLSTELSDEMVHFAVMIQECLVDTKVTETAMYNLLIERNIIDTFPNVEVILRIYLSLMISNCCGERAFSNLKITKNYLRSVMGQTRLVNLFSPQNMMCYGPSMLTILSQILLVSK